MSEAAAVALPTVMDGWCATVVHSTAMGTGTAANMALEATRMITMAIRIKTEIDQSQQSPFTA